MYILCMFFFIACLNAAHGYQLMGKVPHVVRGVDAQRGEFPYQLSLEVDDGRPIGFRHTCGASLLGPRHVLTAAHCTSGRSRVFPFRVVLGAANRTAMDESQIINISKFIEHPEFNRPLGGFPNDVAVLVLAEEALTNQYVAFAKLPNANDEFVGANCMISGWGKTSGFNTGIPTQLQKAKVDQISNEECRESFIVVKPQHICIHDSKNRQIGVCQGDSGGPLSCDDKSGKRGTLVVGIASFVRGTRPPGPTCMPYYPSVYARVSYFLDFIRDGMKQM